MIETFGKTIASNVLKGNYHFNYVFRLCSLIVKYFCYVGLTAEIIVNRYLHFWQIMGSLNEASLHGKSFHPPSLYISAQFSWLRLSGWAINENQSFILHSLYSWTRSTYLLSYNWRNNLSSKLCVRNPNAYTNKSQNFRIIVVLILQTTYLVSSVNPKNQHRRSQAITSHLPYTCRSLQSRLYQDGYFCECI